MLRFTDYILLILTVSFTISCGPETPRAKSHPSDDAVMSGSPNGTVAAPDGSIKNSTGYAPPKKIVLILIDALRPDYLGFVDNETPETAPGLANLSRNAMVFSHAYSTSSWTAPSTASIFTSLYPPGHGVTYGFKAQRSFTRKYKDEEADKLSLHKLPEHINVLPELLRAAGYDTFGLSTNINISRHMGFNRGFNHFKYMPYDSAPAEVVARELSKWKAQIKNAEKSFVYLHLNDVHIPYNVRRPWYSGGNPEDDPAGRYRSEIGYVDAHIQRMLTDIDVNDDTLLIVMSDHGEEFMDHGGTEHGPKLYQELVRVLLMMRWPNGGVASGRTDLNVSHIDILPTLLDFVDIQKPKAIEGTSLVPLLRNSDDGQKALQISHRALFAHRLYSKIRDLHVTALILGPWKIINKYDKHFELYLRTEDKGDHHDLASARPGMRSQLKSRLAKVTNRLNQKDPFNDQVEVKLDEELFERLKRLGYATDTDDRTAAR